MIETAFQWPPTLFRINPHYLTHLNQIRSTYSEIMVYTTHLKVINCKRRYPDFKTTGSTIGLNNRGPGVRGGLLDN